MNQVISESDEYMKTIKHGSKIFFFLFREIALASCKPYESGNFDYFVSIFFVTYDIARHIVGSQEICVKE